MTQKHWTETSPDNAPTSPSPTEAAPKRYEPEPDAPPDDEAAERVLGSADSGGVCDGWEAVAVRTDVDEPGSSL